MILQGVPGHLEVSGNVRADPDAVEAETLPIVLTWAHDLAAPCAS